MRWVKSIQSRDFAYDWRLLCAADFGGVTIRTRYFGAFYRPGHPFAWPQRTHASTRAKGKLFADELRPWRAVAEVLDFSDLGKSIFHRRRPLVDKTLRRILAGLRKFHTQPQIMVCNSPGYCHPITKPIGTLTVVNSKALVTPYVMQYNGQSIGRSIDEPCATVTTESKLYLLNPILAAYYGTVNVSSTEQPSPTITTKDRLSLITPWIDRSFRSGRYQPVSQPAGAVTTVPKMNLCSAFLVNPQYHNSGNTIHAPAPTVIATQRSRPLSLATATNTGNPKWMPCETDTQAMADLKTYMKANGIADIFMRMLKVVELKRIQGFPDNYVLCGPIDQQKKFIGNSVETGVVCAWITAIKNKINAFAT